MVDLPSDRLIAVPLLIQNPNLSLLQIPQKALKTLKLEKSYIKIEFLLEEKHGLSIYTLM